VFSSYQELEASLLVVDGKDGGGCFATLKK